MNEPSEASVALHRAQAIAKASALLCHLDRGDIPAFSELLQVHGALTDSEPICEVVLGMGELALMVLRTALGSEERTSDVLREMTDDLHGIGPPTSSTGH